jgi:ADP-L-glycero-D-manno-heptose 6-epimerase
MKILITGYKGFIGQNMVNALKDDHELRLYELGDEPPDFEGLDWCIHLGAISSTTERNVEKVMRQNHDFSCMVLVACQINNVNLQYASSASVYGLNTDFNEDAPVDPRSPYAWSKYLFDRHVTLNKFENIVVQGFRYFNVYGPHEDHKGDQASPYHKFTQQAKNTGVIKLFEGSENYLRDFVPVQTLCDVHQRFFEVKETGIWNVGTGQAKSFETVANEIAEQYNAKIEYIPMPDSVKTQYQKYTCADLTKLRKTLNESNG